MVINQDYIISEISSLGSDNFDIVISFVLKDILGRQIANVNGNGDGGCDIREFRKATSQDCELYQENTRIGVRVRQVTIQKTNWVEKAISDAKKAKHKLGCVGAFQFFTSRVRTQTELKKLENRIITEVGIPAECFSAREIAGLIHENHIFPQLAMRLNRNVPDTIMGKPSLQLRFLHTLFAFHKNRGVLRSEIYDVVLLNKLFEAGSASRDELVNAVATFLARKGRENEINGRIDSLLNGKIMKVGDNLSLTPDAAAELTAANNCYKREIIQLGNDVSDILASAAGSCNVDTDKMQEFIVLLASNFARHQCELLNNYSGSTLISLPFDYGKELDINRILLEAKVPPTKIERVRFAIIDKASANALIKRLVNAVIFAWSEYGSNSCSVLALGVYDWKSVTVMLDTNVAIPYLLMSYFAPTEDRFSSAVNTVISVLRERGCTIIIPTVYLDECAGHLRDAWRYRNVIEEGIDIMKYSENAFVAHYCQLKLERVSGAPITFEDYISALSLHVKNEQRSWGDIRGSVQNELLERFNAYGIEVEAVHVKRDDSCRKEIETEYSYILKDKGMERRSNLIEHDVTMVSFLKKSDTIGRTVLLTNDSVLQSFAPRHVKDDNLIIGPAEASDLFQSSSGMSNSQLNSLAIALASTNINAECVAAKFIDFILEKAQSREPDWKMFTEMKSLVSEFLSKRANAKSPADSIVKKSEVEAFLRKKGFTLNEEDDVRNEV